MDSNTLNLLGAVFGLIASVAGAVAAVVSLRNRLTTKRTEAAANTASAATSAAIATWKDRTDDLLAAVLMQEVRDARQDKLAQELERIKQYLADHEAEKHAAIRRLVTEPNHQGASHEQF